MVRYMILRLSCGVLAVQLSLMDTFFSEIVFVLWYLYAF